MNAKRLVSCFIIVSSLYPAWSMDCRITYTGIARDGYKKGETVSVSNHFYNCEESTIKKWISDAFRVGSVVYGSSRKKGARGKNPLPDYHFMTPSQAIWCLGALTDMVLWWDFDYEQEDCHNETLSALAR